MFIKTQSNTYTIPAGTKVKVGDITRIQKRTSTVTALTADPRARGKTRITWKSRGYIATATV